MAYPPRLFRPHEIYFITSRTIDGMFFLRPSPAINNLIGSVLADAQERYGIDLFEFVFLSNHLHFIARSKKNQLPQFMQYVKANIAIGVNRLLGRRGPVWERRYSASPILDDGALTERASYIYGHGLKEGLIAKAEQWPGIASVKQRLTGKSPRYFRFDETRITRFRHDHVRPPDRKNYRRAVSIRLANWSLFRDSTPLEAMRQVRRLSRLAGKERNAPGGKAPIQGVRAVLAQDPRSRPLRELNRTRNPLCHSTSKKKRIKYVNSFALFVADYAHASRKFRSGELDVNFPPYAFRPTLPLDVPVQRKRDSRLIA